MKIYPILPGSLYQSGKTDELTIDQKKGLLSMYRLNIIVNLWHTADEQLVQITDLYIHQYYPDGKTNIFAPLQTLADELAVRMQNGSIVLVHCWGGRNRSALLNAMLVMRLWKCDGEKAFNHIKECRPSSFSNKFFEQWLREQGVYDGTTKQEVERPTSRLPDWTT